MNQHKVYKEVFAHRGFHIRYPENTMESFFQAVQQNFAIELDIRFLKCGTLVCFHDLYMKRLLSVPGRISRRTFDEIKKYRILRTKYKVPKFEEVLKMVDGKVTLLVEIKGMMSNAYQNEIRRLLSNYHGKVFFHTSNALTYFKAKRIWKENVFFVLNPFRKRFEFVKGKDYKCFVSIPAIDDVCVEVQDSSKTVIKKLWHAFNSYATRVKPDHWLLEYNGKKNQIQHRGIIDPNLKEHSMESFLECVKQDKVIEFDIIKYQGNIICYHDDSITKKLGQKKAISEKVNINDSLTFEEILSIVDGNVPIIIDIKDFRVFNRSFQDEIMSCLSGYKGQYAVQSFNPLVNMYFRKKYEYVVRGQVGHSLNGLKKLRKFFLTICNFCLFYRGRPDYIVYDLDPNVYSLSKFNNVLGLPVIGYTVTSEEDITNYSRFFDNFIVEGKIEDENVQT